MITCVSLRSGRASSGTWRSENQPASAPASARTTTATRCFAERSMTLLIMAVHPRFGVEEEGAGGDDAVPGDQAVEDFDAVAEPAAGADLARLEHAGAALEEHAGAQSRGDERIGGHSNGRCVRDEQVNVDVHVGAKRKSWIVDLESN